MIKESYSLSDIVETKKGIYSKEIPWVWKLYWETTDEKISSWIELFYGTTPYQDLRDICLSKNSWALLLIESKSKIFALSFGMLWRFFLKKGTYEENFWTITTLNSIDPDTIRSMDSRSLDSDWKQTREQLSKSAGPSFFGFDIEKDLLNSIVWKKLPIDELKDFWEFISWKESLNVSIFLDLKELKWKLDMLFLRYNLDDYKTNFPRFDKITFIKDAVIKTELDKCLVEELYKDSPQNLWLAVPEIIDWSDMAWFKYSTSKREILHDDLYIKEFKERFNDEFSKKQIDFDFLKKHHAYSYAATYDTPKDRWCLYNCFYCEMSYKDKKFVLNNWKWYEIDINLVSDVDGFFDSIPKKSTGLIFPDYINSHKWEWWYNEFLAASSPDFLLTDKKNINFWWWKSSVEFCDVFTKDKKMIHIKKYSWSSTLSHLFNQWWNSAQLLLDKRFRQMVNKKIKDKYGDAVVEKFWVDEDNSPIVSGVYEVVFGIISKSNKELSLPFFSKLSLKNVCEKLGNLRYKYSLVKIKKS